MTLPRLLALIGATALLSTVTACAGEGSTALPGGGPAASAAAGLPDVSVQDVRGGQPVQLASFAPSNRPVLLWIWAPF